MPLVSVSPHAKSAPLPICPSLPTPHAVPRATSLKCTGLIHYSAISLVQRPRGQRVGSLCALSSPTVREECRNTGLVSRARPEGWRYRVRVNLNVFTAGIPASLGCPPPTQLELPHSQSTSLLGFDTPTHTPGSPDLVAPSLFLSRELGFDPSVSRFKHQHFTTARGETCLVCKQHATRLRISFGPMTA